MKIFVALVCALLVVGASGAKWIIENAKTWLHPPVPYSQSAYHNNYRTDCSGYVSMGWQLGTSAVTWTIPNYAHKIKKSQLKGGDVLLNVDEHVLFFDKWANTEKTQYYAYELTPPHVIFHVVNYPYWSGYGVYEPYRLNGVADDEEGALELPTPFNATAKAAEMEAALLAGKKIN